MWWFLPFHFANGVWHRGLFSTQEVVDPLGTWYWTGSTKTGVNHGVMGTTGLEWTTVWWGPQDWSGPQEGVENLEGVETLRVLKTLRVVKTLRVLKTLRVMNHLGNWKTGTQKKENSWKSCTLDTLKFRICELRKFLKSTLTFESKIWNGKISIFILFSWRKVERFLSSFLHVMLVSLIDQFQSII